MSEIISQGAEAIIIKKNNILFKERVEKTYRSKELDDKLRLSRTKREEKVLKKLSSLNIPVPKVFPSKNKFVIEMEFIEGDRLRDVLIKEPKKITFLRQMGELVSKLHENSIIHGDLTTSNIIVNKNNSLVLIDFGLSFFSEKIEDKAVDIHLIKQAIESTHYLEADNYFKEFKKGYSRSDYSEKVFDRLETVELRGRNKH